MLLRDYLGEDFFNPRSSHFGEDFLQKRSAGPQLLLDLDYRTPRAQTFPETAAGLATFFGVATSAVKAIYTCDEASGNLVDKIAGKAAVPQNSPLQDRACPPLWNGTSAYGKKGVEFSDGTAQAFHVTGDTAFCDVDASNDVVHLMVFRETVTPSGNLYVGGKYQGGTGGHALQVRSNNQMRYLTTDGTNSDVLASASGGVIEPGEWNAMLAGTLRGDNHYAYTTWGTAASVAITATGSYVNSNPLAIGTVPGGTVGPVQIAYYAILIAPDLSAALTQANLDAFFQHAKDPGGSGLHPALETYTRASMTAPVVGDDPTDGVRVGKYGSGQFAHGYNANFSHPSKLGMYVADARTNLATDSEALNNTTPWLNKVSTTTRVADDAKAPDGTQTADSIQADANDAAIGDDVVTTAATEYTGSIFHKRNGGADVTGRLIQYNETGAAEQAAVAFTAGVKVARDSLTATTAAGQVSTSLRDEIDTSGEAVHAWGAQFALGKQTSYVPTAGASASRVATAAILDNPGGNTRVKSEKGEIEIVVALDTDTDATERVLFDLNPTTLGANGDRILVEVTTSGTVRCRIWDTSGTIQQNFTAADPGNWDQEHTVRVRWDSTGGVDGNAETADVIIDGVRTAGSSSATWAAGANATKLRPGQRNEASVNHIKGTIARLRAWGSPRPEVVQ